ncbi:hypothetical protein [Haliangium ochraceum]|nr:hypothetical protein [Haliangium ochraceum]
MFQEIAEQVDALWRQQDRRYEAFASVSAEVLKQAKLVERIAPRELLHWVQSSAELPAQIAGENDYGDPAITLYRDERMRIEALFWADNANGVHQHKTPGAFCAIDGRRIHNEYDFIEPKEIWPGTIVGTLSRRSTELIAPGDVREIAAGYDFVHDQWFLDRHSLSISVRLLDNVATALPLIFFPPHLAWSNSVEGGKPTVQKRLNGLRMARNYSMDDYFSLVEAMVVGLDPSSAVAALIDAQPFCEGERFMQLFALACQHHQGLAPYLETVFAKAGRREFLEGFLKSCEQDDLRFFLGLVWSEADEEHFQKLLSSAYPDSDAAQLAARWCEAEDASVRRSLLPSFLAA